MKIRFAIISAISFWLYALAVLVKNVLETAIYSRLVESMVSFSGDDSAIDVSGCQNILLIIGIVSACFFLADIFIEINTSRKNWGIR